MSQPPDKYDRIFDFTDFSAMQPSAQQPGQKIDQELNAARVSINETIDRLNEIQRDDGKLRATAVDTSEFQGIVDAATATATAAATSAATSATTATTKAGEATASATTASNAATTATGASASAQAQATIASTSATTATTKATEASNSAAAALASQTSATASAATATTKAAEASGSAATAATQASNAANSANISSAQANLATASAVAAGNSASTASAQAIAASNSASAASGSASSAASSASLATTKANAASSSASAAAASAASIMALDPVEEAPTDGTQYARKDGAWVSVASTVTSVAGRTGAVTLSNTDISGLGTMATATATDYLSKAGNLSGLANLTTARNNLGLGAENSPSFLNISGEAGGFGIGDTYKQYSVGTASVLGTDSGFQFTSVTQVDDGSGNPIVGNIRGGQYGETGLLFYGRASGWTYTYRLAWDGYDEGKLIVSSTDYTTGDPISSIAIGPESIRFPNASVQTIAFPGFNNVALTGTPTAVTQSAGDNTTALATTAFVQQEVPAASTTAAGKVELATNAEAVAGTSTTLAVTPNGLEAEIVSPTVSKYFFPAWGGSTSGAGAAGLNVFGNQRVVAPSSVIGFASRGHVISQNVRGVNPDNGAVNFSKRIAWGFRLIRYSFGTTDANSVCRVVLGKTGAIGTPTTKSIGIYFTGTSVLSLIVHDGTTLTTVNTTFTPVHLQGFDAVIISDGTGNVSLYVNGTLAATSANGPVGNGASIPDHRIEVENIAVLTGSPMGAYYSNHTISTEA